MGVGVETPLSRMFVISSDDWFEQGTKLGAGHEMVEGRLQFFFKLIEVVLEFLDGTGDEVVVSEVGERYGVVTEDDVYKLSHVVVEDQARKFEVVNEGGGGVRGG